MLRKTIFLVVPLILTPILSCGTHSDPSQAKTASLGGRGLNGTIGLESYRLDGRTLTLVLPPGVCIDQFQIQFVALQRCSDCLRQLELVADTIESCSGDLRRNQISLDLSGQEEPNFIIVNPIVASASEESSI